MGRSPESPALFGDPRSTVTLPVEIGLPPVDTRGEHVFAMFGRKEWLLKKRFLIFIKNSWQTVLQRAETSDNHRMSPTRPEINAKSTLYFGTFSGRVGDICWFGWCLCTLKHRLSWIFDENQKTFFLNPFFSSKDRKNVLSTGVHGRQTDLHG